MGALPLGKALLVMVPMLLGCFLITKVFLLMLIWVYLWNLTIPEKPHREKASSRIVDRRQYPMYYSPHFIDRDTKFQSISRICGDSRLLGKQQLMEEHGWVQTVFWWTSWVPICAEHFNYLSEILNNGFTSNDKVLLVHIPGLDFIDPLFECLRAELLPVLVLSPDLLPRVGCAGSVMIFDLI